MKKIVASIILLTLFTTVALSQIDCSNFLANRKAEPPFKLSSLTKSAPGRSGGHYRYEVPLQTGKEYRIMFFASPSFNNQIHFKVVDKNTGKIILDLPGENPQTGNAKGTAALAPYYDQKLNRDVHPYFDIVPSSPTILEIYIDVADAPTKTDEMGNKYKEDIIGCIGVVILEQDIPKVGF